METLHHWQPHPQQSFPARAGEPVAMPGLVSNPENMERLCRDFPMKRQPACLQTITVITCAARADPITARKRSPMVLIPSPSTD